ncbi:MAG: EAL domain-containing protein [Rhodospirillaceae bacterium]|nr:EAL domain-containing protein [Rhodospirillaceae bacterium]
MQDDLVTGPLAAVLETTTDGVFIAAQNGEIVWLNRAAEIMFGWSRAEFLGRNIKMIVPLPGRLEHDQHLAEFDPSRPLTHVLGSDTALEAERKDGSRFPVEVGIAHYQQDGQRYFAGFVRDITERRSTEERLRFLASHDPVTGLPNDVLLAERLEELLRDHLPVSVLVLTPIGFRRIVEWHGRAAAAHVLRAVADRLKAEPGGMVFFSHFNGETFSVLTLDADPEKLAARLCDLVSRPIAWESVSLYLPMAAGVASAGSGGKEDTVSSLIQDAHMAARHIRSRSPFQGVGLFTEELGQRMARATRLEERLRAALSDEALDRAMTSSGHGLSLALQPKIWAVDGVLLGAEALARWTDDELGPVSPSEFIPIAERTGIVSRISAWMLRRAMKEARLWQDAGLDLSVAVNLSPIGLLHSDFVDVVARALDETGCNPVRVEIELTETAMAEDPILAAEQLRALKEMGVSLSLDDFGTGYSSLSLLRRFPIDTLKIDRSFVIDTPHDKDAVAVVRTVVALAHVLGMRTVAEGVENRGQATFLKELGVDIIQGFFYSPPIDPERFRALALRRAGAPWPPIG